MQFEFAGRTALVTGGRSGIGLGGCAESTYPGASPCGCEGPAAQPAEPGPGVDLSRAATTAHRRSISVGLPSAPTSAPHDTMTIERR